MAFNFINGIELGRDSGSPYAFGPHHLRRMIRLWATKTIGWADHDFSGANWNNPALATLTDGATDASNPKRFTSATGGFTAAMEGMHLHIHPSAAPATAGGFTDATRNGFYRIQHVIDTNTIDVQIWNGVHHTGLPLSETGLYFTVEDFMDKVLIPGDADWFVIRGTGTGGDFDIKWQESASPTYGASKITGSPFADWDNVGNVWSPANRITLETSVSWNSSADLAWVWAVGDLTQLILFVVYANSSGSQTGEAEFIYVGDIDPFHPGVDTRPVVVASGKTTTTFEEQFAFRTDIRMLGGDDTTPVTARVANLTDQANSATVVNVSADENRSWHSNRFVRLPMIIHSDVGGLEEIRGQFKNFDLGHFYGPRGPVGIGATQDRIRFHTQCTAPWNGSDIQRWID